MFDVEISATDEEGRGEADLRRIDATFDTFREFVDRTAGRLSHAGVFLETRDVLPAGSAVRLEFGLRNGTALIRALGEIAEKSDDPPGLDIRLSYLDPASARLIDSISRLARPAAVAAEAPAAEAPAAEAPAAEAPEIGAAAGAAGTAAAGIATAAEPAEPTRETVTADANPEAAVRELQKAAAAEPVTDEANLESAAVGQERAAAALEVTEPQVEAAASEEIAESSDRETPEAHGSWEFEVDSLLSEVLPAAAAAGTGPEAPGAADEGAGMHSTRPIPAVDEAAPAAVEARPGAESLDEFPPAGGEAVAESAAARPQEPPPPGPGGPPPPGAAPRPEAGGDSLMLGFGESITMTPRRRAALAPLLLVLVGVVALGSFLYFRGRGEERPEATVADARPAGSTGAEVRRGPSPGESPGEVREPQAAPPEAAPAAGTETGQPAEGTPPEAVPPEATKDAAGADTGQAPVAAPPVAPPEPAPPVAAPPVAPPEPAPPRAAAEEPAAAIADEGAAPEEVERLVRAWAAAWSDQRVEGYIGCYSDDYSPPGLARKDWEAQRKVRIEAPASIAVEVSQIEVEILGPSRARARFFQLYETDARRLQTWKTMEMERRPDGWRIVREKVGR